MKALLLFLLASGPTPTPTSTTRVEARSNGAIRVIADGGAFGVECLPAGAQDAGCLTTGTQDIKGQKNFQDGLWAVGDIYTSASILAYTGGQARVLGDRPYGDTAPAVVVGNQRGRDGGGVIFSARAGTTNDMVVITEEGNVSLSCGNAATTGQCSFVDATGVSGHITLRSIQGGEVAIQDDLGNPLYVAGYGWDAGLPDGGNPDGGPANTDGGTLYLYYYPYGGRHGGLTVVAGIPNAYSNAWVFQTKNQDNDDWFFIQRNGGFGQANQGHAFSTFGETAPNIATSKGQYYPWGDHASVLRFGRGSTDMDQRWAWKKELGGPLDGGWGIIPDRAEVLRVNGWESTGSQRTQSRADTCNGGTRTIVFEPAFTAAPTCHCSDITDYTKPCGTISKGTTGATFGCNAADNFNYTCIGP